MADETLKIMMSGRVYYGTIVLFAILISVIISFVPILNLLMLAVWGVAVACILAVYVHMHGHWIEFSNEGINVRVGLLNVKTLYIPYQNVDNVGMNVTLFERIAGLAEITIDTKGRAETELVMKNLPLANAEKAVRIVKEKMQSYPTNE